MPYEILGKPVGNIGFGLMSLTAPHNTSSEEEKFALIKAALDAGANILNGGEFYGPSLEENSLTLLNKYFEKYPEDAGRASIHIKGGSRPKLNIDNSPEYTRESVQHCLDQLGGRASIASWEMCRRVSQADYLESLRVLDGFVKEGLIGGVSLSEVNANTIRQAVKICKIVAVEVEISLFNTEPLMNGVCEACAEFGIPIFAYGPLGRGFLTGKVKTLDDLSPLAKWIPRFQGDNFTANLQLVEEVKKWAARKGCTPGQFAINWVASLSRRPGMPKIIPIPGASRMDQVRENLREVELTSADMDEVDAFLARFVAVGARIPEFLEHFLDKTDTTEI
ncbi:NADP-dependent oxidoreductase domain-containing protein [Biscogniauxia mediterranea]|nr:NADP-dependent oxidoreductase domain-containing protein [Biscogniauxia mediterranea]